MEVVTRFPPEPSGYLHFGHVLALLNNFYYAMLHKGKFILRIDDTNPEKEQTNYTTEIVNDCKKLLHTIPEYNLIMDNTIVFASDYFDHMIDNVEKLIENDKAYVETISKDDLSNARSNVCKDSNYVTDSWIRSTKDNLEMWYQMKNGSERERCLCAKVKLPNMPFPTLYRTSTELHSRTGNKYNVYPLYDYANAILDNKLGITHTFRDDAYLDKEKFQQWICDSLGFTVPYMQCFSKFNLEWSLMSKRLINSLILKGVVSNWKDPRLYTIQAQRERGICDKIIIDFIKEYSCGFIGNYMGITTIVIQYIIDQIVKVGIGNYLKMNDNEHMNILDIILNELKDNKKDVMISKFAKDHIKSNKKKDILFNQIFKHDINCQSTGDCTGKSTRVIDTKKLYSQVESYWSTLAVRYIAVPVLSAIICQVYKCSESIDTVPLIPKDIDYGTRTRKTSGNIWIDKNALWSKPKKGLNPKFLEKGDIVNLHRWKGCGGRAVVDKLQYDNDGIVIGLYLSITDSRSSNKEHTWMFFWVDINSAKKIVVDEYYHLLNVSKYDGDMELNLQINKNNYFSHELWADPDIIENTIPNQVVELECIYYVCKQNVSVNKFTMTIPRELGSSKENTPNPYTALSNNDTKSLIPNK